MASHEYQSMVICGHANGSISAYDFKNHKIVHQMIVSAGVQSLCFLNNSLHLVAGLNDGSLYLLESSGSMNTLTIVENAHQPKYDEAVNCITSLMNSDQDGSQRSAKNETLSNNVPFFVTCGADSTIKIFEHNLYQFKKPSETK